MAIKTVCQTPGAIFHTQIEDKSVSVKVDLPFPLGLNPKQARRLEANIHNVMELVLSRYFVK